jgi:hypothetical protein
MSKIVKFGIGLAAGAVVGALAYRAYQRAEDGLRVELVDSVREAYADKEITVVWLFDAPVREGIFAGGLVVSTNDEESSIEFEIEEKTRVIHEIEGETL